MQSFGQRVSALCVGSVLSFGVVANAATIFVDVGSGAAAGTQTTNPSGVTVNNTGGAATTGVLSENLRDSGNLATGIDLTVENTTNVGSGAAAPTANPDSSASPAQLAFAGLTNAQLQSYLATSGSNAMKFTFSDLDPTNKYTFTFYSSRSDNGPRSSSFSAVGANTVTGGPYDATAGAGTTAGNSTQVLTLADVLPDANNTIVISLLRTAGQNAFGFSYANAIRVDSVVPEPTALGVLGLGGLALLRRRGR